VEGETFRRKVYDGLAFCVDDEQQSDGLINSNEWVQLTFEVSGDGSHTLSWLYIKDEEDEDEDNKTRGDCAWLDNVTWISAALPELRFTALSVRNGDEMTVAVTSTDGTISSTEVKNWLEATSDLSDWVGGRLPITVIDLTEDVAETVRFRVTFTNGAPPRAFLRIRKP
jgi:hypothetical protein